MLKTIDGGKSWVVQPVESNLSEYSFSFVNSTKGWAVGEGGSEETQVAGFGGIADQELVWQRIMQIAVLCSA